jgi:hypothetical protein
VVRPSAAKPILVACAEALTALRPATRQRPVIRMLDIINLARPFFGLIFVGLACGKLGRIPDTGLRG